MAQFMNIMNPSGETKILDVGGDFSTWELVGDLNCPVTLLNIYDINSNSAQERAPRFSTVVSDGCNLPYKDASYDLVFSNSVIEHVGTWENQVKFAVEALRVGKAIWIQTPARSFFMEPHLITPFIHFLPRAVQRILLRNFTVWGWLVRPTKDEVEGFLDEVRLLTMAEMETLFPHCTIKKEKFLFIFTKSYTAYRAHE